MDPNSEDELLAEVLASSGVTRVSSREDTFVPPHPIDEVLAAAEGSLRRPLRLLVNESGAPENFVLSGFSFAPIVFSTRYVALTEQLMRLDDPIFDGELRQQMAASIALNTIAEFCLLEGEIKFAAFLFMKSRLVGGQVVFPQMRGILGVGAELWSMESGGVDEDFIARYFFGVAHEIGHTITLGAGEGILPWISDEEIAATLATVAQASRGDAGEVYRERGPGAPLQAGKLREEAAADFAAAWLLARATPTILERYGGTAREVDLNAQAVALVLNYTTLGFVTSCRRSAQMLKLTFRDEYGEREQKRMADLVMQPLGFSVRERILRNHYGFLAFNPPEVFRKVGPEEMWWVQGETREAGTALWDDALQACGPFLEGMNGGLLAAMQGIPPYPFDTAEVDAVVQAYANRFRGIAADLPAEWFLRTGESMGLSQDRLRDLSQYLSLG